MKLQIDFTQKTVKLENNNIDLEKFVEETTNELIQQKNINLGDKLGDNNDTTSNTYKTLEKQKNVNFKVNNEFKIMSICFTNFAIIREKLFIFDE